MLFAFRNTEVPSVAIIENPLFNNQEWGIPIINEAVTYMNTVYNNYSSITNITTHTKDFIVGNFNINKVDNLEPKYDVQSNFTARKFLY